LQQLIGFRVIFLTFNNDETHFLQFLKKKHNETELQIISSNTIITNINTTRFLGLTIDSSLSWKDCITELTSRLNRECYAIRATRPFMSLDVIKMIHFSYVHSAVSYGIIFFGNPHLSGSIFKIQKRIIGIITILVEAFLKFEKE